MLTIRLIVVMYKIPYCVCLIANYMSSKVKKKIFYLHYTHVHVSVSTQEQTQVLSAVMMLCAATDGLFDHMGLRGSYVGPDVALLWPDWDGGERRAPRLEVFRRGVAHELQVLHSSGQFLLRA